MVGGNGGWTIGKHGSPWTPATARKRANEILRAAGANIDLVSEEKQQASQDKVTLKQVAEEFKEDHVAKLKPKSQTGLQQDH